MRTFARGLCLRRRARSRSPPAQVQRGGLYFCASRRVIWACVGTPAGEVLRGVILADLSGPPGADLAGAPHAAARNYKIWGALGARRANTPRYAEPASGTRTHGVDTPKCVAALAERAKNPFERFCVLAGGGVGTF